MGTDSQDWRQHDGNLPPEQSPASAPYLPVQAQQPPPTGYAQYPQPGYGQQPHPSQGQYAQPGYGQPVQGHQQYVTGPPPMPYAGHPVMQVQPRSPVLYALASFLIAGLGTMLGGQVGRGLVILAAVVVCWMLLFIPFVWLLTVPLWIGAWVFSVVDGYRTAQRWNSQHGIIS